MKSILFALALLAGVGVFNSSSAQVNIPSYTADVLNQRMMKGGDTVYVINFWATWCGPCVKELPEFGKLHDRFQGKPVKVLLVSMDFKESYPARLAIYIKKKDIRPEVVWFSETNADSFIPKIDNAWSGALPATLIVSSAKKVHLFLEKTITEEELAIEVQKHLP